MELSVVMAAFNEEVVIKESIQKILENVAPYVTSFEIVVVNDGSNDRTADILADCADTDARIRVIHQANAGHGPAMLTALSNARGDALFLLDSDNQVSLDDFGKQWQAFQTHDAVIGIRTPRYDGFARAVISYCMRIMILALYGHAPKDAGVPFKLVRAIDWRSIAPVIGRTNVIPSVLLAIHLFKSGRNVIECPVIHRPRVGSQSTLRFTRLAKFCMVAAGALWMFRSAIRETPELGATSKAQT